MELKKSLKVNKQSCLNTLYKYIKPVVPAVMTFALLSCAIKPDLPTDLEGKAIIVLGFTADSAIPYDGGTLYTGLRISSLDDESIGPPSLGRYDYLLVDPGQHNLKGYCYWQLRGSLRMEDDLQEPAELSLDTKANTRYTIQSDIDEYKSRCHLSVIVTPHP